MLEDKEIEDLRRALLLAMQVLKPFKRKADKALCDRLEKLKDKLDEW